MGYVDSSQGLSVDKGVIQMMVKDDIRAISLIALIVFVLVITGCGSLNATEMGNKAREVEEALCPLQTAKNLDNTINNLFDLVPIVAWEPVCKED